MSCSTSWNPPISSNVLSEGRTGATSLWIGGIGIVKARRMDADEILHCDYVQWSQVFLEHIWPAVCLELPDAFVEYLKEDGVHVCGDSKALPVRQQGDGWTTSEDDEEEKSDGRSTFESWKRSKDQHPDVTRYTGGQMSEHHSTVSADLPKQQPVADQTRTNAEIQQLAEQVDQAILSLGGSVHPRLNWSCPSDAIWVTTTGSLRCMNADEVFLLLKCSSRIAYDLGEWKEVCFNGTTQYNLVEKEPKLQLILRKWKDVRQHMEFRAFVKNNEIVGICQRDPTVCHNYKKEDVTRMESRIDRFFETHVRGKFPSSNFVLDLYVEQKEKVHIVDFNTFGGTTQALLFTWEELAHGPCKERMRVVNDADLIQPSPKVCTGVPLDLVDTSHGSALLDFLQRVQVEQAEL
uniref:Cell division cycle protein 123 homolog n=1 Tax=Picocystis salinarum TaxID=88271 RepID=A0A7S3XC99_9CHLO|mmetsp:Transcript_5341/g.33495  ORF Transcript_5341/g.33495 Transcript_5341/m.33495 type:complete len:406 (+) Transcript_5341:37-1254(+)